MAARAAVSRAVRLHALLDSPDVPWWRFLEISRYPSFIRTSGMDFGCLLSSRESVPWHGSGGCHPADGRHFAEHHALGRTVHDLPFGIRPRQSQLDARAV